MINEITNKKGWNQVLKKVSNYDFYHTYDYHSISLKKGETPMLLVYEERDSIIGLPLILRPIEDTEYFDFTSVYGYAGPISRNINSNFNYIKFHTELNKYLKSKNIISIFSRLHPYFEQDHIIQGLGKIESLGKVINIDVSLPIDESRRAYGKSNKNQINRLRRQCTVNKVTSKEDILDFIDIYYENMQRLDAKSHYYFDKQYFLDFVNKNDFQTDILMVKENETGKFIAGSMFVKTNNIVQFHLSGTRTEYLKMKPSKLFIDEMRLLATREGFIYFNLGGGLGSNEDSLFDFKASFSKDFRIFKIWKYIVNQEVYNSLSIDKSDSQFFPRYRANQY